MTKLAAHTLTAILLLNAPFAHAQSHAVDAAKSDALARWNEGIALVDHGDYEGARLKFVAALAVLTATDATLRTANVLLNLAVCEMHTARPIEAAGHLRRILRDHDPRTQQSTRDSARQLLGELALSHVTVTAPDGADVMVDGKIAGRAPLVDPLDVPPGSHVFAIQSGGDHAEAQHACAVHEDTHVELRFPASTTVVVTTQSGATPTPTEAWSTHHVFAPPTGALVLGGVGDRISIRNRIRRRLVQSQQQRADARQNS